MMDNQCKCKRRVAEIIVPLTLLLVASAVFFFTDLDVKVISLFFDQASGSFPLHKSLGPRISYYVVPAIGIAMALGGLLVAIAGVWFRPWRRFRKEAAFLFLLVLLGPGLFVNGLFKEYYGRPRPNQCEVFGGTEAYRPVLMYTHHDGEQKFRSFPCGHASIGFAVMAPYFFLRRRNRCRARTFLMLGLLLGSISGGARMIEGRHFASDVIWAAGMVYFVGLALARPFRFEKESRCASAQ